MAQKNYFVNVDVLLVKIAYLSLKIYLWKLNFAHPYIHITELIYEVKNVEQCTYIHLQPFVPYKTMYMNL